LDQKYEYGSRLVIGENNPKNHSRTLVVMVNTKIRFILRLSRTLGLHLAIRGAYDLELRLVEGIVASLNLQCGAGLRM
jgi:hypothetical protein